MDEELEELMQEQLDEKMMKTGQVPTDKVSALPSAPEGVKAGKAPARVEEDDEEWVRRTMRIMIMMLHMIDAMMTMMIRTL